MNKPPVDAGIPLLTEIISPAPAAPAPASAPLSAPSATQLLAGSTSLAERAAQEWDEETWNRMEQELRERILQQVLKRVDFVLEQRVRDSLADVLQLAVSGLAAEIQEGLHATVKDVVIRAVAQEITKLQSLKK